MKLLLIDGDPSLAGSIETYFQAKRITLRYLDDYNCVLKELQHINLHAFDAFIFGISEADKRGVELMEYLRLIAIERPVIFISHDDTADLLSIAFARGGEDYLAVPFRLKELELRVLKAIRKTIPRDDVGLSDGYRYIFSEQAVVRHASCIDLTAKEQQLLYLLMTHKNRLVSYDMIQSALYHDGAASHNAIASHIRNIRKKIAGIPLKALRGMGYILRPGKHTDSEQQP